MYVADNRNRWANKKDSSPVIILSFVQTNGLPQHSAGITAVRL
jgi:hypothetical protein